MRSSVAFTARSCSSSARPVGQPLALFTRNVRDEDQGGPVVEGNGAALTWAIAKSETGDALARNCRSPATFRILLERKPNAISADMRRHRATWTSDDVASLKQLLATDQSMREAARALGRTEEAVRAQATKIGLVTARRRRKQPQGSDKWG